MDNAEQGKEDGVVGAVDDAEQEQGEGVSPTLTSFMLHEFLSEPIYYMNLYIK